jgi:hypothetical protein
MTKKMAVDLLSTGYTEIKNGNKSITLTFTDNGEKVRYRVKNE